MLRQKETGWPFAPPLPRPLAGDDDSSVEALLDVQRLYREGNASLVSDDVERLTGREPITFDQFARDYAFAFQDEEKVAI
jgi:hypothetical protein